MRYFLTCVAVACCWPTTVQAASPESAAAVIDAVGELKKAAAIGQGNAAFQESWKVVAAAEADAIPMILRSLDEANPIAENWICSAADTIADRTLRAGDELPTEQLVELVKDSKAPGRGRRVAYELLHGIDSEMAEDLLPTMIDDPNLDLRYDAIALLLKDVAELPDESDEEKIEKKYVLKRLLDASREVSQLQRCKRELKELGEEVDLAKQMGFITAWKIIGPFDNTGQKGFNVVYPPEKQVDLEAKLEGKSGEVEWTKEPATTDDQLGALDVTKTLGPVKGAVAYAYAEFESNKARNVFIRYGTSNATKLWVNGKLVAEHEVYHTGDPVDQYSHEVELKEGTNTFLLKVCQNEQKQPWAQDWSFRFRVTDSTGGAIHSKASE